MTVKELIELLQKSGRPNKPVTIWLDGVVYEIDAVDLCLDRSVELNVKEPETK